MSGLFHEPVMVSEVIKFLVPGPGRLIVDCTVGGGGHAEAILSGRVRAGGGNVRLLIGIDQDPEAIHEAAARLEQFKPRVILKRRSFDALPEILHEEGIDKVDGILMDLGASRHQLTQGPRGFSLKADAPLDMRMDPDQPESAADLLARLAEKELSLLIKTYGEERYAARIARAIVRKRAEGRPVATTRELAALVERAVSSGSRAKIHPATRTFMALRIAVNHELEKLEQVLEAIPACLNPGGRAVVISYHSLEDRLVKQSFVREARGCVCPPDIPRCVCGKEPRLKVLTKRPVMSDESEVSANPAARSARLRAAERLEDGR